MPAFPQPGLERRWKKVPGQPNGDAGDPYTGYDRFDRTEAMLWGRPQEGGGFEKLVEVQWGYDRASLKTWRKDSLAPASTGQDQHFGYDGLYQVTERQRGLDIDQSRVNNRSNQITQVNGSSSGVSYDKNGNVLEVPTGEGLTGPSRKLVWDAWNRLVDARDAEDTLLGSYQYDAATRRTVSSTGSVEEPVTRQFYYDDQWRSVEERPHATTDPERQFVWHPEDRYELLLRDRTGSGSVPFDERLYPMNDELDPVAVCEANGSVVERYAYSAFGMTSFLNADFTPASGNASAHAWNFLFHAEFAETDTGWFNYGFRYYQPETGRWLSRDPIGIKGGLNLYEMVGNDAVNRWDRLGLAPDPGFSPTAPKNTKCCTQAERDKGQQQLKDTYQKVKDAADKAGIPSDGTGEGNFSCYNLNSPTFTDLTRDNPKCWTCVLEPRKNFWGYDHWAVVCHSYKENGTEDKQLTFDLWNDKNSNKKPEDGYYKAYPYTNESDSTGRSITGPKGDCDRKPMTYNSGFGPTKPGAWAPGQKDLQ